MIAFLHALVPVLWILAALCLWVAYMWAISDAEDPYGLDGRRRDGR